MYKLSVIILAHNRSHALIPLINKFLNIKDVEILIMENGSNEMNKKKIWKIEKDFKHAKNVKFYFDDLASLPRARKQGVLKATGEYIFFCDDNDIPTAKFINWANKPYDKDLYRFNIIIKKKKTKKYPNSEIHPKIISYSLNGSTIVIKRDIILDIYNRVHVPNDIYKGEEEILLTNIFLYCAKWRKKINNQKIASIHHWIPKKRYRHIYSTKYYETMINFLIKNVNLLNPFWKKLFEKIFEDKMYKPQLTFLLRNKDTPIKYIKVELIGKDKYVFKVIEKEIIEYMPKSLIKLL